MAHGAPLEGKGLSCLTTFDVFIMGAQLDIQLKYHPMTSPDVSSCP